MKATEFKKLIREEIHKVLKEAQGEQTYRFQLYGAKIEWTPMKFDYRLTKGTTKVTLLTVGKENLPTPVTLQPKMGARGGVGASTQLTVTATPETFAQVIDKYINANTKEFTTESKGAKVQVQIPPAELERIKKKVIEAFQTQQPAY
jgi:hypothetical protein